MIPGTFVGLIALAAALGPGYIYVQRARRHHERPAQSQLGELAELVVVGGLASLLAAGIVLSIVNATGFVDVSEVHEDVAAYVLTQPVRTFVSLLGFYGLAYGFALLVSHLTFRGETKAIEPGSSTWIRTMWVDLPNKRKPPIITIELKDGRKFAGGLRTFTGTPEEDREIALARPIVVQAGPNTAAVELPDDFIVFREKDIALLSGKY